MFSSFTPFSKLLMNQCNVSKECFLFDEKCLKIYEINEISENKIIRYKLLMENIILEYHKICKEMFNNN